MNRRSRSGRAHRQQADLRGETGKALAEVVHVLTVVQAEPMHVLRLQRPFVVKEVRVHVLVLVPAPSAAQIHIFSELASTWMSLKRLLVCHERQLHTRAG